MPAGCRVWMETCRVRPPQLQGLRSLSLRQTKSLSAKPRATELCKHPLKDVLFPGTVPGPYQQRPRLCVRLSWRGQAAPETKTFSQRKTLSLHASKDLYIVIPGRALSVGPTGHAPLLGPLLFPLLTPTHLPGPHCMDPCLTFSLPTQLSRLRPPPGQLNLRTHQL